MAICKETLAHDIQMSTLKARDVARRQADLHVAQTQDRARQAEVALRAQAPAPRVELPHAYKEAAGLTDGFDVVKTDRAAQARLLGLPPPVVFQELRRAA